MLVEKQKWNIFLKLKNSYFADTHLFKNVFEEVVCIWLKKKSISVNVKVVAKDLFAQ